VTHIYSNGRSARTVQHGAVRTVVRVPPYEGLVAAMELGVRCIELRVRFSVGEEVEFVGDIARERMSGGGVMTVGDGGMGPCIVKVYRNQFRNQK
jgi:hypothetical protein